jgi:hypothetical protein
MIAIARGGELSLIIRGRMIGGRGTGEEDPTWTSLLAFWCGLSVKNTQECIREGLQMGPFLLMACLGWHCKIRKGPLQG